MKKLLIFIAAVLFVCGKVHALSMKGNFSTKGNFTVVSGSAPTGGGGLADDTLLVGDNSDYTNETSITDGSTSGIFSGVNFTAVQSGTVRECFVKGYTTSAPMDSFIAIYNSSDGLICQSQTFSSMGESLAWQGPYDMTGQGCGNITASTSYKLALGGTYYRITVWSGTGAGDMKDDHTFTGTTAPSTLSYDGSQSMTAPWSIYCTNGTEP